NPRMLAFLRGLTPTAGGVAPVCTGAMILAPARPLGGPHPPTQRGGTSAQIPPTALPREEDPRSRVGTAPGGDAGPVATGADEGAVVTGGGVSLAIDLTLHLLERLGGARLAAETARIIEYTTARQANVAAFRALA